MDSRPFRPRGTENAIPALHQRHKSTGNLKAVDANGAAGFRGPARRAAFGDVTNMSRNVAHSREEAKNVKVLASAAPHHVQLPAPNKENMPYSKDALARPAQRLGVLSDKPKGVVASHSANSVNNSTRPASQGISGADVGPQISAKNEQAVPTKHERAFEAPPMQPRHHKSQPQLKPQHALVEVQDMLSQKSTEPAHVRHSASNIEVAVEASRQRSESLDNLGAAGRVRLVGLSPLTEDCADMNHERGADSASIDPNLALEEDIALAAAIARDGTIPSLSETEEYWEEEEDDEDYDDQDQAYMTAHSSRSRDLTTGGSTTVLFPKVTGRVQRELEEARVDTEKNRSQEDICDEMWDVSMVAEYGDDINEYMRELEIRMLPNPYYMDSQTEIQWSMRSVLMDWLVQVHGRFGLLPETLFLTVNYIDRFLTCKIVSIGKLQLAGATALLIASKYEEINCPSLQDIVYMVDGSYSAEEILKAERYMLSMLNFELGWPGPMSFLRRVSKADDYNLETRTLAKYFLELTIMDERFVASPPSYLAAGAHCLARLVLKKGSWTKAHTHWSGYTWTQLKPLVTMILECCEDPRLHHAAIFEKYSEKRFKEASLIVQEALDAGFSLPYQPVSSRGLSAQAGVDHTSESLEHSRMPLVPIEG